METIPNTNLIGTTNMANQVTPFPGTYTSPSSSGTYTINTGTTTTTWKSIRLPKLSEEYIEVASNEPSFLSKLTIIKE